MFCKGDRVVYADTGMVGIVTDVFPKVHKGEMLFQVELEPLAVPSQDLRLASDQD